MDRPTLDSLYAANKTRAFKRALSEPQLDAGSYGLLLDHVEELDIPLLIKILAAPLAEEVEPHHEPFIKRLADLLPAAGLGQLFHVLPLSASLDPIAWADLTRRLRGRLPDWQWYRLVDRVRGARIFTILNVVPAEARQESLC
ncbi:MAG: hypothetical protein ACREJ3_18450, partial [Polyangiaceae bacterium]